MYIAGEIYLVTVVVPHVPPPRLPYRGVAWRSITKGISRIIYYWDLLVYVFIGLVLDCVALGRV